MINDTLPHAMTLYVNGPAGGTGAWQNLSDIRLKKNISSISDPLGKIMNMQGVEFEWNTTLVSDPGKHVGFIAQDMLKVVPEIVNTQGDYFSMQYAPITAILVEAFKIQQKTIGKQQEDIEMLKKANLELREQNMELFKYLDIIKAQIDTKMK
jgi:hypothetical protein